MDRRCIVVTGSSSGIGKSIAAELLESGAMVVGIARDHSKFSPDSSNYWPHQVDLQIWANCRTLFRISL